VLPAAARHVQIVTTVNRVVIDYLDQRGLFSAFRAGSLRRNNPSRAWWSGVISCRDAIKLQRSLCPRKLPRGELLLLWPPYATETKAPILKTRRA
jgi:hypothetical protein